MSQRLLPWSISDMMSKGFLGVLMGLCWGKDLNSRWIRCFTAGATTSRTLRLWSSGVYSEICSQKQGIVSDRPESWICAPRQVEKVPIWLHRFAKRSGMTSCLSRMRSCAQGCLSWLTTLRCGAIRTWLSQAWILRRSQGWRAFSTSLSQMFLAPAKECSARMPRLSRIGRKM